MALRERVVSASRFWLFSGLLVLAALLAVSSLKSSNTSYFPDARQVLYRYAEQVRVGHGLVFNVDEPSLLIPSPAYMLLLAGVAQLLTLNVITAAQIIFAISLAFGVMYTFRLARRLNIPLIPAIIIAAGYAMAWPLWAGVGTAFPVSTVLCLVAYDLALTNQWRLAGLVMALAVLCTPTSLFLALPLLVLAFNRNTPSTYITALLVPVALAFVALYAYYGDNLLDGLLLLKDNARDTSLFTNPTALIALPIFGLAAWGWYKERNNSTVALLAAAITFYLAVTAGILRTDTSWRYIPIVAPTLLLAVVGLRNIPALRNQLQIESLIITALLVIGFIPTLATPEFTPNVDPALATARSIGVADTPTALSSLYFASQSVIAFDGQLSPELKSMLERDDRQSLMIRFAPDVIVGRANSSDMQSDPVARLNYRGSGNSSDDGVFVRQSELGKFMSLVVDKQFGTDIRLVGAAVDQSTLKPGQVVRVRLDWQFARYASKTITIDLRLRSGEYLLAHSTDSYVDKDRIFIPGAWSTYHTLKVIDDAWSGPVTLEAVVIVSDGVIGRVPITTLDVTES